MIALRDDVFGLQDRSTSRSLSLLTCPSARNLVFRSTLDYSTWFLCLLNLRAHHSVVRVEIARHVELLAKGRLPKCLKRCVLKNCRQSEIGVGSDDTLGRESVVTFGFVGPLGVGGDSALKEEGLGPARTFRDSEHAHAERSRLDSGLKNSRERADHAVALSVQA